MTHFQYIFMFQPVKWPFNRITSSNHNSHSQSTIMKYDLDMIVAELVLNANTSHVTLKIPPD